MEAIQEKQNLEKGPGKKDPLKVSVENATAQSSPVSAPRTFVPELFSYLDYRVYLSAWFQARKLFQPGYSGALFAKKAGLQSHTILGMVIRGDRNLSSDSIRGFIRALGLKSKEALYFEKLVLFNQSKNSEDRAYYFEQLSSVSGSTKEGERTLITSIKNHAAYLSHWYHAAIREMANLPEFKADAEWISAKLKKKITKKQAEDTLTLLFDLGMILRIETGEKVSFQVVDPLLDIDPGSIDFAVKNFHKEYLERSKDALDGDPYHEREFSSLTMSISESDLELLKTKIKEFRKSLNREFPVSNDAKTRVIAINMQLLNLTTPNQNQAKTK